MQRSKPKTEITIAPLGLGGPAAAIFKTLIQAAAAAKLLISYSKFLAAQPKGKQAGHKKQKAKPVKIYRSSKALILVNPDTGHTIKMQHIKGGETLRGYKTRKISIPTRRPKLKFKFIKTGKQETIYSLAMQKPGEILNKPTPNFPAGGVKCSGEEKTTGVYLKKA